MLSMFPSIRVVPDRNVASVAIALGHRHWVFGGSGGRSLPLSAKSIHADTAEPYADIRLAPHANTFERRLRRFQREC